MAVQVAQHPRDRGSSVVQRASSSRHDALDRLPVAAYACDADGRITQYNARAAELWGREPKLHDAGDRFCGSVRLYTAGGEPLAHDRCWAALALAHRRPCNGFEAIVEQPGGARRRVLALATPLFDDDDALIGALNVVVDVTEHHAGKRAFDADRSKDELIATLAHELRNPLAPIRNAVYLLKHLCPKTTDVTNALEIIDRQSRHISRLLDDLLEGAQLAKRRLQLRCARVEIADVIRDALETTRSRYDHAGQHLAVSQPSEPIWIFADRLRLAQAVSNLLDNASKYMHPGGCAWLDVDVADGDAVVTVSDDGVGISQELLPHVFDLFTHAADDEGRAKGGLGIGLALARHVVEAHRGTLTAQSDGVNKGSRFVLRIPLLG